MGLKFAPFNQEAAKRTYSGRSMDLNALLSHIGAGECVALYGEPRGGKSLTLAMVYDIISGDIQSYAMELWDDDLRARLGQWQGQIANCRALNASLNGTRTEQELLDLLMKECRRLNLVSSTVLIDGTGAAESPSTPTTMTDLFDHLQNSMSHRKLSLVLLIDEMDLLAVFDAGQGEKVAELLCNRRRYPNILFIATGAYEWSRHSGRNSPFRTAKRHHLRTIQEGDLCRFLLKPLVGHDLRRKVALMTGGRPFYAQLVGEKLLEGSPLTIEGLLSDDDIREHLKLSVFLETASLLTESRTLALIAHHPGIKARRVWARLSLPRATVQDVLSRLVSFGTVSTRRGRYSIVGTLIEAGWRVVTDDPARASASDSSVRKARTGLGLRIFAVALLLVGVSVLQIYTHPGRAQATGSCPGYNIAVDYPRSLEAQERCDVQARVTRRTGGKQASLSLTFCSEDVVYSSNGTNTVTAKPTRPYETVTLYMQALMLKAAHDAATTVVRSGGACVLQFDIQRRSWPLKAYANLLSALGVALGILINWTSLPSFVEALQRILGGTAAAARKA